MRRILFALLAVLLVAMQHEGLVHPFAHLGSQLSRAQDTGLTAPLDGEPCAECVLLAGGSHAAHGDAALALPATLVAGPVRSNFQSRAADTPAWFHSRAPPVLL